MWTYEQLTGRLYHDDKLAGVGYSGFATGKNNPAAEAEKGIGPVPEGTYTLEGPFDSIDHGPQVWRLVPDSTTQEYGRSGFLMHGDSLEHPGEASRGCIIMPRFTRDSIAASEDRKLTVVQELPPVFFDPEISV